MSMKKTARYRRDARVLRALANETRLMMIDRLAEGECCVCDLVDLVGCDQSTVSKHLALLRQTGIVEGERRGNHIYYKLLTPCVLSVLTCATGVRRERAMVRAEADLEPGRQGTEPEGQKPEGKEPEGKKLDGREPDEPAS